MSAEILRRAAAGMRERAEAATPGPWDLNPDEGGVTDVIGPWSDSPTREGVYRADCVVTAGDADAAHIASWHPAVALAVADWLDVVGGMYPDGHSIGNAHALTIARAYLGSES